MEEVHEEVRYTRRRSLRRSGIQEGGLSGVQVYKKEVYQEARYARRRSIRRSSMQGGGLQKVNHSINFMMKENQEVKLRFT